MILPRPTTITLEQAVLRCEHCNEVLAVVESLGDSKETVYLWRHDDDTEPPRCHGKGVTAWQAEKAYLADGCDHYFQTVIDTYAWPDREIPEPDLEPVLEFDDEHEQLGMP